MGYFCLLVIIFLPGTHSVLYKRVHCLPESLPVGINVPGINVNFPLYSKQYLVEENIFGIKISYIAPGSWKVTV